MMAYDVFEDIAQDVADAQPYLDEAEKIIEVAREAGEDVTEMETSLRDTKSRIERWKRTLEARGYTIPQPKGV